MVFAVHTTVNYMYVLVILWFWYSPVTITCGSKWNTSLRLLDNVSVLKSLFHWSDSPFWLILWVCIWYKNSNLAVSWHHIYVVRDLASLLLRTLEFFQGFVLFHEIHQGSILELGCNSLIFIHWNISKMSQTFAWLDGVRDGYQLTAILDNKLK